MPRVNSGWIEMQVAEENAAIGSLEWLNEAYALTATAGDVVGAGLFSWQASQSSGGLNAITRYLVVRSPNIVVPVDMRLAGIELSLLVYANGREYSVKLLKDGAVVGAEKASFRSWDYRYGGAAGLGEVTYGGPNDLWGVSLIEENAINANFGFAIAAQITSVGGNGTGTAWLAYAKAKFHYDYGGMFAGM